MSDDLIRMEHISKFYGRVQALDDVTFTVRHREIVGLLGDNGAGKSTLIKVLSGAAPATSGEITVRGKKVDIRSTRDAIAQGIETIYQDSALVTQLSIARNLFLGREPVKGPRFLNCMDTALMDVAAVLDPLRKVGIGKSIPTSTPISSLSGGERQAVAIARAMHFDSDLHHPRRANEQPRRRRDARRAALRAQRSRLGDSCIFIAHNIHHVFQVVDRIAGDAPGEDRRRRHRPETHDGRRRRGRHHWGIGGAGSTDRAGPSEPVRISRRHGVECRPLYPEYLSGPPDRPIVASGWGDNCRTA